MQAIFADCKRAWKDLGDVAKGTLSVPPIPGRRVLHLERTSDVQGRFFKRMYVRLFEVENDAGYSYRYRRSQMVR